MKFMRALSVRTICLWIWGWIQGVRTMWTTDPHVIKRVLQNSTDKGHFIEEWIAMDAWKPILSLESTNGPQWVKLKDNFFRINQVLPSVASLRERTELETALFFSNDTWAHNKDAADISRLILRIWVTWLFECSNEESLDAVCNESQQLLLVRAAETWKRELALKGPGCKKTKYATVDWMIGALQKSPRFADAFLGQDFADPMLYSVVLQPFIISPMINIGDICVTWKLQSADAQIWNAQSLHNLICLAHPFPILERFISDNLVDFVNDNKNTKSTVVIVPANTQVFIPLDNMSHPCVRHAFGAGKRMCAGNNLATTMLLTLFELFETHRKHVYPEQGHRYSGRQNDNSPDEGYDVVLYQMKRMVSITGRMINAQISSWFR